MIFSILENSGEGSIASHDGGEFLASFDGTGLCLLMSYRPDQPCAKLGVEVNTQLTTEKNNQLQSHTGVANGSNAFRAFSGSIPGCKL